MTFVLTGFAVITGAHREFVRRTVTNTGEALESRDESNEQAPKVAPERYVKLESPWVYLKHSVRPPKFFVRGESHIALYHRSRDYKERTEGDFRDYPFRYLEWNLGGRLFLLWHWDNTYNGDVYIYPMIRKGFEEGPLLRLVHRTMRSIHGPLYLLSLVAPIVFLIRWRRKTLSVEHRALLVPVLGFACFLAVLSLLTWLPRYTIPARPFSYILASASLSWLVLHIKNWAFVEGDRHPPGRRKRERPKRSHNPKRRRSEKKRH